MPTQKLPYRIKGCGCSCATMPADPCVPCTAGAYQLQCRARAGSASLCGWPEYIPSTIPRYYLNAVHSGSASITRYGGVGASCGGGPEMSTWNAVGSGSKRWNPVGCTLSNTAQLSVDIHLEDSSSLNGDYSFSCPTAPASLDWSMNTCTSLMGLWQESTTRTVQTSQGWTTGIPPVDVACGCDGVRTIVDCGAGLKISLQEEDTEEAAMNRSSATWGAWQTGVGGCCTSTTRGMPAGRNFTFSQAQIRIRVAGAPGSLIHVKLTYGRSDGSSYYEVRQFSATEANFPSNPDAGWMEINITTPSGLSTCLLSHELYIP